ncbi:hypothetical protein [Mesorhizobium sp. CN2-181]|uniref:hypothetical protein n=1 Tax=Mesorhizobium yinganensis TaxID=3157707 RepID=UPI0032B7578C
MLTRRRLLTSAPALTVAAATPAVAAFVMPNDADADAELLRLGAEFERLYKEWIPLWHESERTHDVWWQTFEARGLTWNENQEAIFAVSHEVGNEHAANVSNAALDKVNETAERIRATEPQTLAGLAVWAKVAKFESMPMSVASVQEITANELEWEHECLLKFFDQVDRMAGAVAS